MTDVIAYLNAHSAALDEFLAAKGDAILPALGRFKRLNDGLTKLVLDDRGTFFMVHAACVRADALLDAAMLERGIA